jgi:hypothetical protein
MNWMSAKTDRETSLKNRRLGMALAFLTVVYIAAVIVFLIVK